MAGEVYSNSYYDPDAYMPGMVQAEDGSWGPAYPDAIWDF